MQKTIVRILTGFIPTKNLRQKFRECHEKKEIHIISDTEVLDYLYSNINNSNYSNLYKKLYHLFFNLKSESMNDFIVNKILKENVEATVLKLKQQNPDKEMLFLTDTDYEIENLININIADIKDYSNKKDYLFIIGYNKDYTALKAIDEITKCKAKYYVIEQANPLARYFHIDKYAYETLIEEWRSPDRKHHFCPIDFENIFQALNITKHLEGDYIEIGTYQGSSAHAVLNYIQKTGIARKSYFLDTYEGFNYEAAQNSKDAAWYNTHTETSIEAVKEYLSKFDNFEVVKNNICTDSLPQNIEKIAVANIDVDMYDAIKAALYKVKDKIVQHGVILVEDFGHTPWLMGAQKAYTEFMEEFGDEFISIYGSGSQMFLIKK